MKTKKVVNDSVVKVDMVPVLKMSYNQISNLGFCFALLNNDLRALHTPFECKDYLQDIFWSDRVGKSASIWGMEWKHGIFDSRADRFKLALSHGSDDLSQIAPLMQEFINHFDAAQGIESTQVMKTEDKHIIMVDFDKGWTTCGPQLSALTTIIRVSGDYIGGDPIDYLTTIKEAPEPSIKHKWIRVEISRLSYTLKRLAALLDGKHVEYAWEKSKSAQNAHNTGIMGFDEFPEVDV